MTLAEWYENWDATEPVTQTPQWAVWACECGHARIETRIQIQIRDDFTCSKCDGSPVFLGVFDGDHEGAFA